MIENACFGMLGSEEAAELVDTLDVMGTYHELKHREGGKISGCGAFLEFTVEAARSPANKNYKGHLLLMMTVMRALMEIPSGDSALHRLRASGTPSQTARNNLLEAERNLKNAARLLGLPEDFYIRTVRLEKRRKHFLDLLNSEPGADGFIFEEISNLSEATEYLKTFPALSDTYPVEHILKAFETIRMADVLGRWTEAPDLEGETPEENRIRQRLARFHFDKIGRCTIEIVDHLVGIHDYRNGAGGTNRSTTQLAIRMIWDHWPKNMREGRGKDWQPKRVAAEIIKYCGHSADSRAVGRYASNQQAREREKDRSIQVPSSS